MPPLRSCLPPSPVSGAPISLATQSRLPDGTGVGGGFADPDGSGVGRDSFFLSNDVPRDYSGPAAIDRALLEKAPGRLATELKGSHVVCQLLGARWSAEINGPHAGAIDPFQVTPDRTLLSLGGGGGIRQVPQVGDC